MLFSFPNLTVMQLSIVSLAPHYLGNSRAVAGTYPGIYRKLCPCRPGTYTPGRTLDVTKYKIESLGKVYLWSRCLGLKGWDLPGDLQEQSHPQSWTDNTQGWFWMLQKTKISAWASPHYLQVVGGQDTVDSCINQW